MLAKWNPFNGGIARSASLMPAFDQLFKEADTLMESSFRDLALPSNWVAASAYVPPADIVETADAIAVTVDLPGHDPNNLKVKLEGDTLTIQSERKQEHEEQHTGYIRSERSYGTFARSFVLPSSVDGSRCEACYENGVLTVSLPKREEAKPKTINIKVQP